MAKKCINGWCSIPSAVTAEIVARQPFDTLTIDLQHGLIDYQTALTMLQAMGVSNVPKLARVRWNDPGFIMALLDAGFTGIICPMVNSGQDARDFIAACRYAPDGGTFLWTDPCIDCLWTGLHERSQYPDHQLAMIETREAMNNLDAILRADGLDAVYIGPSDLSVSMGHAPSLEPTESEIIDAIATIREKAHAAGVHAGIHVGSAEFASAMLADGFDLVSLSTDVRIFSSVMANTLAAVRRRTGGKGVKSLY